MMDRKAIPFAAASLRSGARNPVTLDVPVRIRAEAHQAHPAFIEDTRTALVFSRGAVVPVGEPLNVGQSVVLTHRRTRQEIPCRVVYAKSQAGPGVKGYVELEFLRPAPNFWEIQFPYDDDVEAAAATRSGAAVVNVPAPRPPMAPPPVAEFPDGPKDVVTLADAVTPVRRAKPVVNVPFKPPVASNQPLVEDIETLLDRKAAASAAQNREPFTFNLPLDEHDIVAPRARRGHAWIGRAAAGIALALISFGAWHMLAGSAQTSAQEIGAAQVAAFQAPVAPEIPQLKVEPRPEPASASSVAAPESLVAAVESAKPIAPPVVEQSHSAPIPIAKAKALEAARAAEQYANRYNQPMEPRPLVRVMTPAAPLRAARAEPSASAPEVGAAPPAVAASISPAPLGSLARTVAPPPIQGGRAVAPKLTYTARLLYPPLARRANVQGDVVIDAMVNTKGVVRDMKVVSGHTMLHQAALESVGQWRYEPGTLNGQPVEVRVSVLVKFRLTVQ